MRWYNHGDRVYTNATVQQSPGAYLYTGYYSGTQNTYRPARWFEPPCTFSGFTPPSDAHMQTNVPAGAQCYVWPNYHSVYVDYPYRLASDITPTAPPHPYNASVDPTPGIVVPAPPDPGTSAVEAAAGGPLSDDSNDVLQATIDWTLSPSRQEEERPVKPAISEDDRTCKLAYSERWTYAESVGHDPGERAPNDTSSDPPEGFHRDDYETVLGTVDLNWGTKAWGERHIRWRHGFDAAAQTRTRAALEGDATPTPDPRGGYDFYAPLSPVAGVACYQKVVVSANPEYGVITSFIVGGTPT